jgi:glutathione synthase/RimK-type ligase-like ATP-grasp enzyme
VFYGKIDSTKFRKIMKTVGYVYNFEDTNKQIVESLKNIDGFNVIPLHSETITVKQIIETIPEGSVIIWRVLPDHAQGKIRAIAELEEKGYTVINSAEATETANDKLLAYKKLLEHKTPTIPTWECAAGVQIPVNHIVKPRFGLKGENILYGENTVETILEAPTSKAVAPNVQNWIMQPYIPASEKWLRVLVVNGEPIVAYRRVPKKGSNIANVSQGATRQIVELTNSLKTIAVHATKNVGLHISGVDITHEPHLIVEVNSVPAIPEFAVEETVNQFEIMLNSLFDN